MSFITEELVIRLGLKRQKATIPLVGIGDVAAGTTRGMVEVQLKSLYLDSKICKLRMFVVARVIAELPEFETSFLNRAPFLDLELADSQIGQAAKLHLLIGVDNYKRIVEPVSPILDESSEMMAFKTIFGWAMLGPTAVLTNETKLLSFHCRQDNELQDLLTTFWRLEEFNPLSSPAISPEEQICEDYFLSTVSRDHSGRYIVRLPFKSSPEVLGDSRQKAVKTLNRVVQRFKRDPAYKDLYEEFMKEYISLNHMTQKSDTFNTSNSHFYLPHHGVVKMQGSSPKIRVVFNGSSETSSGISLNNVLHQGAKLQTNVLDILMRFRLHHYIFTTDIEKMYRQILIHPEDWKYQQIVWMDDHSKYVDFQLTTVTYGLNCAPFLALRTLQQLVRDEGDRFPKAVEILTKDRYIDDIFGGADTVEELKFIISDVQGLCEAGGFPLRKWRFNYCDLMDHDSSKLMFKDVSGVDSDRIKILGVVWQPNTDRLTFSVNSRGKESTTKRTILGEIAQLFDPLGLISPIIVRAKIFMQELWKLNQGWDEVLPSEMLHKWKIFRQQLQQVTDLSVPRWLQFSPLRTMPELHGFSDASQDAMAAVIYLKTQSLNGEVNCSLVISKTRVAPIKGMTVPRLELSAALLLSQLMHRANLALNFKNVPIYLWSDSSITLTWLSAHPAKWKDFVRNRVATIKELVPDASWKFVPGKENPADGASRGMSAQQLKDDSTWWHGPKWLARSASHWPNSPPYIEANSSLELRTSKTVVLKINTGPPLWDLLGKYSSLRKLLKVTAWCWRATQRFKRIELKEDCFVLTPSEVEKSCVFWSNKTQASFFQAEIEILKNVGHLPNSHPLCRLTPFLDGNGTLRVGGRLEQSNLARDSKHPIILPKDCQLSILVIRDAHERTFHGGTQITLAYIRQRFWILGGRTPVKSYILRCVKCNRFRVKRAQQLMGQLPPSRVRPSRPFLNTGVDYAGPFFVKAWKGRVSTKYKAYVAIFVCQSTSAVHIELVSDYTTAAFVAAYKRFTGRRNVCQTLHSDCGTNFVGADKELRRLFDQSSKELKELAGLLTNIGTKWLFIPPASPHFGGQWEAAVKSVKYHLRRTVGDSLMTYEEFTTLLIQIEAILNSRPLSPLYDEADDLSVLTPGHFLMGEAPLLISEPCLMRVPENRLTRWERIRKQVDQFWDKWSRECLQRYLSRSKWRSQLDLIKVGTLVLITDERYPPAKWPLARVTQLHPGKDGLTRVVTLKTAVGTLTRPISKLCVVPISTAPSFEN